jgi:superfamily II RNA helicase
MEKMVTSDDATRRTPALLFCFNREMCWTTAEMLKGKKCVAKDQQKTLSDRLNAFDWSQGAGPKMKQLLMRGIGVHHAGVLPKYRRIVEQLFQEKLLSICVCTDDFKRPSGKDEIDGCGGSPSDFWPCRSSSI